MSHFFGLREVRVGGAMFLGGGVDGGLSFLGFSDEGLKQDSPRGGDDFRWSSSCFLKSSNISNFSQPGLKDLTRELANCLGGVLNLPTNDAVDFGFGSLVGFMVYQSL